MGLMVAICSMKTIFAELYTPPLIPIGFLLDSYIPCGFPMDFTPEMENVSHITVMPIQRE